jgi:hypothetical protein
VDGAKTDPPHDDASQKKVTPVMNPNIIELFDEDDPKPDHNEEVIEAKEERKDVGDFSRRTIE